MGRIGYRTATRAAALLNDPRMKQVDEENVKGWIKKNCRRIDILLNVKLGPSMLELVEAILHCRYEPKYESKAPG